MNVALLLIVGLKRRELLAERLNAACRHVARRARRERLPVGAFGRDPARGRRRQAPVLS